jgi:hypothetical protein
MTNSGVTFLYQVCFRTAYCRLLEIFAVRASALASTLVSLCLDLPNNKVVFFFLSAQKLVMCPRGLSTSACLLYTYNNNSSSSSGVNMPPGKFRNSTKADFKQEFPSTEKEKEGQ